MKYEIPLFDLNFDKKEEEAVIRTLRSKWISMGPECQKLETEFSAMLNVKHLIALANCTVVLYQLGLA